MNRKPYTSTSPNKNMARAKICLNCGDNRAEENKALCNSCVNHMQMGGYRGDDL